jgi:hypothetical protein
MKKFFLMAVLLIVGVTLFGQLHVGAGGKVGITPSMYNMSVDIPPIDGSMDLTYIFLDVGVYVDATYVRIAVDYLMNISESGKAEGLSAYGYPEGDLTFHDDYAISYLNLSILGKYPINLGMMTIWPAAGVRYAICVNLDENGDGENDLDDGGYDMNDFYIIGGVGIDVSLGPVMLSPCALFGWNLTPNISEDDPPDGITQTWFDIEITVGIGINLM